MSRPRKPFGANHPGRLPATMMKVLAAEMSDPSRLRRGKQYAKDGSVLDFVIDPGAVTCEIQGSRSTPYIATIEVTRGDGMPLRRDIVASCTCPDDDNWDGYACKHVVAAMFTFSDELLLEPELLDVWRHRGEPQVPASAPSSDETGGSDAGETDTGGRRRRHLRLVGHDEEAQTEAEGGVPSDPLHDLLAVPEGSEVPDIGPIPDVDLLMPKRTDLAAVYRDALGHVRVIWDLSLIHI